jgi:CDP-diacylglycerol--glycerol-3-phosphate 3-phosphatidyltransferase
MANLITLSRLLMLIAVVVIAYQPPTPAHFLNVGLLVLVFISDGLDGYVARKRNEVSLFGAMFDIAGDRIVELTMWIVLADLNLVPIWVPLVFVVRGVIVDTIRASQTTSRRQSPFSMIQGPVGQWLVGGAFMRFSYAALKGATFCWLLIVQTARGALPEFWAEWGHVFSKTAIVLVYLSVVICIVRGLPVVIEFVYSERDVILGRSAKERTSPG